MTGDSIRVCPVGQILASAAAGESEDAVPWERNPDSVHGAVEVVLFAVKLYLPQYGLLNHFSESVCRFTEGQTGKEKLYQAGLKYPQPSGFCAIAMLLTVAG